jgi:hypothetical protein
MKIETKLTTVHVIDELYKKFKVESISGSINLQKLVNRCMDLYINDESFRNSVSNHVIDVASDKKF